MKRPPETPWPPNSIGPDEYNTLPAGTHLRDHFGYPITSKPGVIPSGVFPMTIERSGR